MDGTRVLGDMTAASLLAAIKHFRTPAMKKLINAEFYEKADSELKDLEPMLHMLNLGKAIARMYVQGL